MDAMALSSFEQLQEQLVQDWLQHRAGLIGVFSLY